MNINDLERNMGVVPKSNYTPIIQLIIDAVRDYPKEDLVDIDTFIIEIKRLLKSKQITQSKLISYVNKNNTKELWVTISLNSFIEAFDLMNLYKLSFSDVLLEIKRIGR